MSIATRIEQHLSEHFKSYVLLAYDYDGNNFILRRIENQEELDALSAVFAREGVEFERNIYRENDGE